MENTLNIKDIYIGNHLYLQVNDTTRVVCEVVEIKGYSNSLRVNYANPDATKANGHPIIQATCTMDRFSGIELTNDWLFLLKHNPSLLSNPNFVELRFGKIDFKQYFNNTIITINCENGVTYARSGQNGDEIRLNRKIRFQHQFVNIVYQLTEVEL